MKGSTEDTRAFLRSIDTSHVVGLRDRALIAVMVYSFARVSAVVGLKVEDYFPLKKRWWLRLHEKGGKVNEMGCHRSANLLGRFSVPLLLRPRLTPTW
jgi:site-specific recombinase XerD